MRASRRAAWLVVVLPVLGLVPALTLVSPGCRRTARVETAAVAQKWQCPMHPDVVKDQPGDCPICNMKLVPIETGTPPSTVSGGVPGDGGNGGIPGFAAVALDERKRQLLGVKTAPVERGRLSGSIRTVGRVAYDERRIHHVHTRFEAYVENVAADFTGKFVRKGEELARVYSPEVYATQQEYLLALRASRALGTSGVPSVSEGGQRLLEAARQRLLLWQISPADIRRIEEKGEAIRSLPLYAPISGYVTGRMAYHGMKVMPADALFDIVDLTQLWVLADVYENELPRLRLGQRAEMTLSYWPGRSWKGTVTFIYPAVDEKTRTVRVRIEVPNPEGELKPEMFADVVIQGQTRDVLQIPADAVIDSGTRKVVFLSLEDGSLAPREVSLGAQGEGKVEVLSGLAEGDSVVVGANFLVDSESRLKAALGAMGAGTTSPAGAPVVTPPAGHVH